MKKILITIMILLSASLAVQSYAATPTPTTSAPTPTNSPTPTPNELLNQQINDLKERIASRVAELKLVEKQGFIGTVTDVSDSQLTLSDMQKNIRFVDVDELTKFSSPSAKDGFGISDITKGSLVSILGLTNKETRRTLARFVDVITLPKVIHGAITSIDSSNYVITVSTPDQKDIPVDIENITKTYTYANATDGLVKSGFSKMQQGERIMVTGFTDVSNKNRIIASRIIIFPSLPPNPRIVLINPAEMQITPATGSGRKLVPIVKTK